MTSGGTSRFAGASRGWREEGAAFWIAAISLAFVTIPLRVAYVTLDDVANGRLDTLPVRVLEESTGVLTAALLFAVVAAPVARRFPFTANWKRALLAQALVFPLVTVAHTLLMAGSRAMLCELLGMGPYSYGPLGVRMLMEAPNDLIFYSLFVVVFEWYRGARARRDRERRALELERELASAELANLRLQLQPHFLFNALNTIASSTWEDPAAADAMIGHLSELLRHALSTEGRDELPLGEELELLEHYLALARARFGDSLELRMEVDASARTAMVPPLLLQPLVENAIQHGVSPDGKGDVTVTASRNGTRLSLVVENPFNPSSSGGRGSEGHGRHDAPVRTSGGGRAVMHATTGRSADGLRVHGERGVGLSTTVRRLTLLHGSEATVESGPVDGGRWRVRIELPFRSAAREA